MEKETLRYLRDKHKALNEQLVDLKKQNLLLLEKQLETIDGEIDRTHRKLQWLAKFFAVVIAFTIVMGLVASIALGFLTALGIGLATAGVTGLSAPVEMTFYYAATGPVQSRLDRLNSGKAEIIKELSNSVHEITEFMVDEQSAITSVLTGKEIIKEANYVKTD